MCNADGEVPASEPEHDRTLAPHVTGGAWLHHKMHKLARVCNVRNATRQGCIVLPDSAQCGGEVESLLTAADHGTVWIEDAQERVRACVLVVEHVHALHEACHARAWNCCMREARRTC